MARREDVLLVRSQTEPVAIILRIGKENKDWLSPIRKGTALGI
jgi:hypothetical protein